MTVRKGARQGERTPARRVWKVGALKNPPLSVPPRHVTILTPLPVGTQRCVYCLAAAGFTRGERRMCLRHFLQERRQMR